MSTVKEAFPIPVLGVIEAGARMAILNTKSKNIAVIGTRRTIESNAYKNAIKLIDNNINVYQKETPLLVPLVEENFYYHKATEMVLKEYLDDLVFNVDTLILGCTHYPILSKTIADLYPHLFIIDPAVEVALELTNILDNINIISDDKNKALYRFCITDNDKDVLSVTKSILGNINNNIITSMEEVKL